MCSAADMMREKAAEMLNARADWLEDVLAGLLAAGVSIGEIEVQEFQSEPLRTVVAVRGVPKYEWRGKFTISGQT
jgi:hypothetical protein